MSCAGASMAQSEEVDYDPTNTPDEAEAILIAVNHKASLFWNNEEDHLINQVPARCTGLSEGVELCNLHATRSHGCYWASRAAHASGDAESVRCA